MISNGKKTKIRFQKIPLMAKGLTVTSCVQMNLSHPKDVEITWKNQKRRRGNCVLSSANNFVASYLLTFSNFCYTTREPKSRRNISNHIGWIYYIKKYSIFFWYTNIAPPIKEQYCKYSMRSASMQHACTHTLPLYPLHCTKFSPPSSLCTKLSPSSSPIRNPKKTR